MIRHIFTHAGYKFWRDDSGLWNVTRADTSAPPDNCAYSTPKAIADLKGIVLRNVLGFDI